MLKPGAEIAIVAETSFWDSPRMLYVLKAKQVRLMSFTFTIFDLSRGVGEGHNSKPSGAAAKPPGGQTALDSSCPAAVLGTGRCCSDATFEAC